MLPSLYIEPYKLFGFIPIQPFGVLVALALILGYTLGRRRAERTGLDPQLCADGEVWMVVCGFALAHWVSVIFYFPERLVQDPLSLLKFWSGLSSFGGIIGGILGLLIYFRRKGVSAMQYADAIIFGFVPAWIFGRLGCTVVFDHPGKPTTFFLGMMHHKQHIVLHNLGLYEALVAIGLTIVLYSLKNVRPFEGFHPALMLLLYSPVRFYLDTLRAPPTNEGDIRYFGLTPGQYFAIGMAAFAIWLMVRGWRRRHAVPAAKAEPAPVSQSIRHKRRRS